MSMNTFFQRAALPSLLLSVAPWVSADGFIEDSKLKLQLRNVYFNENFRDEHGLSTRAALTAKSERTEWAQGLLLDYQSGFTQGVLGFGFDASGLLGIKLDSGKGRSGTGLLPVHSDGRAADEFSSLGAAAKVRLARTIVKYGSLLPRTPVLVYNDARLLPQVYQGTQFTSTDIENLTLTGGRLDQFKLRDSSDSRSIIPDGFSGKGSDFSYVGGDYRLGKDVRLSYFYGELDEFYRQQFASIQHDLTLGSGVLTSDLRYFRSVDAGAARSGKIDNDMLSGQLTYALSGHSVGAGYQVLSGDAGLPYISGATVYSFSNVGIGKFIEEDEKTWMVSYGYDFARLGAPGLTFSTRYLRGDNEKSGPAQLREWERDAEIAYVVQGGTFKGLGVKLRNYVYRSDFARGRDSNRLYLTYDVALW
ncbi:OprD family porin [Pseudomonas alliivorans]|uniref:OprD family porin n=2 Tax=Pseudomonas alliivorans TaxID=2810613 RepID=A0ABS4CA05_9PSED|nr:OprD family porin [Pseudomonas alliivorans]MBP0947473.1 OprD family porin [Pseudomonas alliivorans]MEE4326889.1 OprD family porin [Pseudomonas alliivorans]MEE4335440.1 OprD family porin [Pseudomonas alliivorans]MEE4368419.1 OprD family porin [Pseudomonas alliivorans]MEE4918750.1 OprD family porin [Pseudomonas alliivorans]